MSQPPLPVWMLDDGSVTCEGRTAPSVRDLCRQMLAASFDPQQPLIVRRIDQEVVRTVPSIGAEVGD
jgi:hypothetical protein